MKTAMQRPDTRIESQARTVHLADHSAEQLRDRLRDELAGAGFSVLAEFDLAEVLRRRIAADLQPHYVLEVCRPELAGRALQVAADATLLLPCRIGVWAEGTGATAGMIPPTRQVEALGREHLDAIAAETEERLDNVLGELLVPKHWARSPATTATTTATVPATPTAPAPAAAALTDDERTTVIEALRRRIQALLPEAAGTEKHDLQHALAQNIDALEAVIAKLSGSAGS
jgi:uncharacterized protein (DUF302 family)